MARRPRPMTIEARTPLIPSIVADGVVDEIVMLAAASDLPVAATIQASLEGAGRREFSDALAGRADVHYAASEDFRKKLNGTDCREMLYGFMRHWSASELAREHGREALRVVGDDFARGVEPARLEPVRSPGPSMP